MDNLALSQGGNFAFTSGALAAGTNAGTIQNAAAITYTINGEFKSKAITNNVAISYAGPAVYSQDAVASNGGFTGQVGGSTRLYGIYLDGAGNYSIEPGKVVNTAQLSAGTAPLEFPGMQRGKACVGAMRVAVTANTTFVPGTTALNAAGVTVSFLNLSSIPGEPLTA
jgi:hypothetical protein